MRTETTPSKKVNETEDSKAGIETLSIAEEEKVINPITDKSDPPSSPKVKKQNKLNLQNHLQTTRISYHLKQRRTLHQRRMKRKISFKERDSKTNELSRSMPSKMTRIVS